MRRFARILPVLFLTILSGCTSSPKTVVEIKPVPILPPAEIFKPCPVRSTKPLNVTGDVWDHMTIAERGLAICAAQVDAGRRWRDKTIKAGTV